MLITYIQTFTELDLYNTINSNIRGSKKTTPSGWVSFNAPCCSHVDASHRADRLKRGGLKISSDGVAYHCFNCGFSTVWKQGKPLSRKFQSLLSWLGVDNEDILKIKNAIWRQNLETEEDTIKSLLKPKRKIQSKLVFPSVNLPEDARTIEDIIISGNASQEELNKILYLESRGVFVLDRLSNFYSSNSKTDGMNERVIIPCYWNNFYYTESGNKVDNWDIVGYIGRTVNNHRYRYFNVKVPKDYIFNTEVIKPEHKFLIVSEGPFDAIALNGISLLGNKCSETQANWINSQNKDVYVVPDRDGKESFLTKNALKYGWNVATPDWDQSVKDGADAAKKYGQIFAITTVLGMNKEKSNNE